MKFLRSALKNPYFYAFTLSYYGVWLIWDGIKLPDATPDGIISYLPSIHYNPANNILRFVLAVFVPPLACLILGMLLNAKLRQASISAFISAAWRKKYQAYKKQPSYLRHIRYVAPATLVAMSLLLCVGMGMVQNSTNAANNPPDVYGGPYGHALVDTFHDGETLGTAVSYQRPELKPYRDFVVIHGVFQDPLRSVIAFKLFGRSIGSVYAFTTLLTIAAFVAYYGLLLVLFRGNLFKAAAGLWALALLMLPALTLPFIGSYIFGVQFPFRDIATILFLIAAIIGFRAVNGKQVRRQQAAALAIGCIAVAGFANSIDRAFYITTLSAIWLAMLYIMLRPQDQDNSRRSRRPGRGLFAERIGLPFAIGAVAGLLVLGLALKWAFADFAEYLLTISSYKEYLDGMIFAKPNIAVSIVLITAAALVTISGAHLLRILQLSAGSGRDGRRQASFSVEALKTRFARIMTALQPIVARHAVIILLGCTALIFLRSAIGRALPDHFIYSVQWLYLFLVYVGITYLYARLDGRNDTEVVPVPIPTHKHSTTGQGRTIFNFFAVMLLVFCLALFGAMVKRINVGQDTLPLHVPDAAYMRTDYLETAKYLKHNLKQNESFVTLTSEASWYYFADRPSPIKYPVIWYAFTAPERQGIAKDLAKDSNIKYVITNNNWTSNFDYVSNEVRFPEIYQVLKERYAPHTGFGQQTVWIRR